MIHKASGIYLSTLFNVPDIIHGFSTKQFQDMRDEEKRNRFLRTVGIQTQSLVYQTQNHDDSIHIVSGSEVGTVVKNVDGMVYRKNVVDPLITLSVHTADCVPLLFYDPEKKIISVVHAGWKGTVLHIGKKCIKEMNRLGARSEDIRVFVGPSICVDCYEVDKIRGELFQKEFPFTGVVRKKNRKWFVNIPESNVLDLIASGVLGAHIDYDPLLCTYSRQDEFYSFRRTGSPLDGEILGIIGFK